MGVQREAILQQCGVTIQDTVTEADDFLRPTNRQLLQENGVRQGEYGSIHADSQRQRDDGSGAVSR